MTTKLAIGLAALLMTTTLAAALPRIDGDAGGLEKKHSGTLTRPDIGRGPAQAATPSAGPRAPSANSPVQSRPDAFTGDASAGAGNGGGGGGPGGLGPEDGRQFD